MAINKPFDFNAQKEAAFSIGGAIFADWDVVLGAPRVAGAAKAHGIFTTAGGDATESIPVTGVVAGDIAIVTVKTAGATPRSIVAAAATTGAITVTLSGDPSTDHVLQYIVLRAV